MINLSEVAETVFVNNVKPINNKFGGVTYRVDITTGSDYWDGTDDPIYMSLVGDSGIVMTLGQLRLGSMFSGILKAGSQDILTFNSSWDVGKVKCIELTAGGDDAWMFTKISVTSSTGENVHNDFYNDEGVWLSSDTTEGFDRWNSCAYRRV